MMAETLDLVAGDDLSPQVESVSIGAVWEAFEHTLETMSQTFVESVAVEAMKKCNHLEMSGASALFVNLVECKMYLIKV